MGTEVLIRLKWGQTEYRGTLESIDSYMNVLLRDTQEFIDGKLTGALGLVLIRYAMRASISLASGRIPMILVWLTLFLSLPQMQQHSLDGLGQRSRDDGHGI